METRKYGTTNLNDARRVGRRMPLFTKVEPTAKELYGVATPVLDEQRSVRYLNACLLTKEGYEAALQILENRVEALASR